MRRACCSSPWDRRTRGVARRIGTADATAGALRAALTELVADPEVARRSARLRAEGGAVRAAGPVEGVPG